MNHREHCRIDLSQGRSCDPPLELKKSGNKHPTTKDFRFVPKFLPALEKFVRKVVWNSVDKTLTVRILETPHFESFAWFGSINDRYSESQKSSFVDFEQDSIRLFFLDQDKSEIACFKFKNLRLLEHEVCAQSGNSEWGIDCPSEHLCHKIVISYADQKVVPIQHAEAAAAAEMSDQKAVDSEWQTVQMAEV